MNKGREKESTNNKKFSINVALEKYTTRIARIFQSVLMHPCYVPSIGSVGW